MLKRVIHFKKRCLKELEDIEQEANDADILIGTLETMHCLIEDMLEHVEDAEGDILAK